jgi:phosphoesterase RecJ-like protein
MLNKANKLKELLNTSKEIVITTHRGPDGDAMGSSLALYNLLISLNHKVTVITPNDYASFLNWMPGNNDVVEFESNEIKAIEITKNAELIFMLDFNDIKRIDKYAKYVDQSNAFKILIDHHQDPDLEIAELIFSDPLSSSTCQLLYEILDLMNFNTYITKEIAECLYVGIMTDTGSFKYNSTTAKTHNIVANLIDCGINSSNIHDLIYDNSSADRMKLLGYCINDKLLLYPKNNAAIISLTNTELEKYNFKKGDTEGIVNYALAIKDINIAVLVVERGDVVKLSLRSKGSIKVNIIANKYFNGGGHTNAAGGISYISVDETIIKLENIFKDKILNN